MKRKFAYQHPLFGHTKEQKELGRYRTTVYYLWWEFLRRSDAYREFCSYAGTKEPGRFSALYEDFGDVFSTDFNVWWRTSDRGANLFAERLPPNMQVLTQFPDATTAGGNPPARPKAPEVEFSTKEFLYEEVKIYR